MTCPQCGAEVPPKAKACPECGSCEETGWSEAARSSGLGLPDEDFDYDEFVEREFGRKSQSPKPYGISWFWWVVAILVLIAMVAMFLHLR